MMHPEMGPMLVSMCVVLDGRPREAAEAALAPLRALEPVQVRLAGCATRRPDLLYKGVGAMWQHHHA
jgi:Ni,Fe-hydrogenase III small subunit